MVRGPSKTTSEAPKAGRHFSSSSLSELAYTASVGRWNQACSKSAWSRSDVSCPDATQSESQGARFMLPMCQRGKQRASPLGLEQLSAVETGRRSWTNDSCGDTDLEVGAAATSKVGSFSGPVVNRSLAGDLFNAAARLENPFATCRSLVPARHVILGRGNIQSRGRPRRHAACCQHSDHAAASSLLRERRIRPLKWQTTGNNPPYPCLCTVIQVSFPWLCLVGRNIAIFRPSF
jgi:hypothetical protein